MIAGTVSRLMLVSIKPQANEARVEVTVISDVRTAGDRVRASTPP